MDMTPQDTLRTRLSFFETRLGHTTGPLALHPRSFCGAGDASPPGVHGRSATNYSAVCSGSVPRPVTWLSRCHWMFNIFLRKNGEHPHPRLPKVRILDVAVKCEISGRASLNPLTTGERMNTTPLFSEHTLLKATWKPLMTDD